MISSKLSSDETACPYCGGSSLAHISAPDINRRATDRVFHLRRCTACGLMFVFDPPEDLGPYYATEYHYIPTDAAELEHHLPAEQFKIDIVQRFKSSGSLLEIGPSSGAFCRLAQKAGFDVSAIEMDADCVQFLNEKLGVRAITSGDPAGVLAGEHYSYDAICLWHAIEHMPTPWTVLKEASRRLNPDGVLVVAAPNPLAWQARLMKGRWPHFDLPRHLFELPIDWLVTFGGKLGLTPELVTTRDKGSLYWNRFSWGMLLRSLSRNPLVQDRFWRLGLQVGRLLEPWESREGHGATYTIILRRPA
jgi:SAM-dependent methyltransferase